MARPPKSLLKDSHPELAEEVYDKSLLPTLATGADKSIEWIGKCGHRWFAKPYNRTNAKNPTGCPYCDNKKVLVGFNDVATTNPDVAKLFANPSEAFLYTKNSNKKVLLKCEKGHTWMAPVSRLTTQGSGCPYCSHRLAFAGESDLQTTHPDLAQELFDKSLATKLTAGSNKKVKWVCRENPEHVWEATPYARTTKHTGCPYCSGRNIIRGVNDFATIYPELTQSMVNPELALNVGRTSEIKAQWICPNNPSHIWETTFNNRPHTGCPICANKMIAPSENDIGTTHPDLAKELVNQEDAIRYSYGSGVNLLWQCEKGHQWRISPSHRTGKNSTGCPICNPTGTSKSEKDLQEIVKTIMGSETVLCNDKTILPGRQELDIVVPSMKIAIEYNGTRWHSELCKSNSDYHLKKQQLCTSLGYRLIFIWEDDFLQRRDTVIKMLAYKLHHIGAIKDLVSDYDEKVCQTVYARQLIVSEVTGYDARCFLEQNHIQGSVTSSVHLALKDTDGDIRALLSLRSPKNCSRMYRDDGEWEIQRYATKGHIPGGFTKLLKAAEKLLLSKGYDLTKWVSFSSNDVSDGSLYRQSGFVIDNILKPDYKIVGDYTKWKRVPKEQFQKKRFRSDDSLLWDENWTEREALAANKLYRIFDAGKIKWIKYVINDKED